MICVLRMRGKVKWLFGDLKDEPRQRLKKHTLVPLLFLGTQEGCILEPLPEVHWGYETALANGT